MLSLFSYPFLNFPVYVVIKLVTGTNKILWIGPIFFLIFHSKKIEILVEKSQLST